MDKKVEYIGKLSDLNGVYRVKDDKIIIGRSRYAYIHNAQWFLTTIKIYADGMIDAWGLLTFEEFKQKVFDGFIRFEIPENTTVFIHMLGDFEVSNVDNEIELMEGFAEIIDIMEELKGNPSSSKICREAFYEFQKLPSKKTYLKLKTSYIRVPYHLKPFILGDMDYRDAKIKDILIEKKEEYDS